MITETLLQNIADKISDELLKRGFNTPISITEEDGRLWIKSEPFQTTPVLFKSLYISADSSNKRKCNKLSR